MPRRSTVTRPVSSASSSPSEAERISDSESDVPVSTSHANHPPRRRPSQGGKAPRSCFANAARLVMTVAPRDDEAGPSTSSAAKQTKKTASSKKSKAKKTAGASKKTSTKKGNTNTRRGRNAPQLQSTSGGHGDSDPEEPQDDIAAAALLAFERVKQEEKEMEKALENDEEFQKIKKLSQQT